MSTLPPSNVKQFPEDSLEKQVYTMVDSLEENIPNVAFKTGEGKKVVIIQNKNGTAKNIQVKTGMQSLTITLKAGAVGTLLF